MVEGRLCAEVAGQLGRSVGAIYTARSRVMQRLKEEFAHFVWDETEETFALLFADVLIVLELNKGKLTIESEVDDVTVRISKGGEYVEKLAVTRSGTSVRLSAGNYVVQLDGAADGITIKGGTVSLQRGGREIVTIIETRVPEAAAAKDVGNRSPESVDATPTPNYSDGRDSGAGNQLALRQREWSSRLASSAIGHERISRRRERR